MRAERKQNHSVWTVSAALLLVLDLASMAALFSRLTSYSQTPFPHIIPLTKSGGATTVTAETVRSGNLTAELPVPVQDMLARGAGAVLRRNPGFRTYDEKTVWRSETEVEIFRLTYDSENGITVQGTDDDKLIAPGTTNTYSFTLENTGDVLLDYDMTMEAKITGTELEMPVKARVKDYTGKYLLGNAETKKDVLELNSVEEHAKLSAGRFALYTLEWEWPYEWGNDAYDTKLGNLAVDDDLRLTIKINTVASADDSDSQDQNDSKTTILPNEPDDFSNQTTSAVSEPAAATGTTPAPAEKQEHYGLENPVKAPQTGAALGILPTVILTAALAAMLCARPKRRYPDDRDENA